MKWEYLSTWLGLEYDKDLSELGDLGWELTTIVKFDESLRAFFKRPLEEIPKILIVNMGHDFDIDNIKNEIHKALNRDD